MCRKKAFTALYPYAESVSNQLKSNDQERTGRAYMTVVRRFIAFLGKEDVYFSDFTPQAMNRFQAMLLKEGRAMNTVSFYMRNLRVIYNRAYEDDLFRKKDDKIFKHVFTGSAPTQKRALTKEEMAAISNMNAEIAHRKKRKELHECQLYFSFCVYGRGISFIDMCFLRKKHIRDGAIYYNRKKTGKQLVLKITQQMQEILNYFSDQVESSSFLFPLLDEKSANSLRAQYERVLSKQNRLLKEVGRLAGLTSPLSTHVARHTWATLAYRKGTSIGVISQALGHRDEKTTAIYLASFDESEIDQLSVDISNMISRGVRTKS